MSSTRKGLVLFIFKLIDIHELTGNHNKSTHTQSVQIPVHFTAFQSLKRCSQCSFIVTAWYIVCLTTAVRISPQYNNILRHIHKPRQSLELYWPMMNLLIFFVILVSMAM